MENSFTRMKSIFFQVFSSFILILMPSFGGLQLRCQASEEFDAKLRRQSLLFQGHRKRSQGHRIPPVSSPSKLAKVFFRFTHSLILRKEKTKTNEKDSAWDEPLAAKDFFEIELKNSACRERTKPSKQGKTKSREILQGDLKDPDTKTKKMNKKQGNRGHLKKLSSHRNQFFTFLRKPCLPSFLLFFSLLPPSLRSLIREKRMNNKKEEGKQVFRKKNLSEKNKKYFVKEKNFFLS